MQFLVDAQLPPRFLTHSKGARDLERVTGNSALERKLDAVAKSWLDVSRMAQMAMAKRLSRIGARAQNIGWGYGDYVYDVIRRLKVNP